DVWIMSKDEIQSEQYFLNCKRWARVLGHAARDHGEQLFTPNGKAVKVRVLTFASGASIYALSSNPDAIVGKSGHVKLDEFALHRDQRLLYAVAKPVTQWRGTLSIISTQRGRGTIFNKIITDIKERGNPMGWSLHEIPIQLAVEQGIVEKINRTSGRHESRQQWLQRQHDECIDEEHWKQEYCCTPADESSAFISYDMINAAEDPNLRIMSLQEFLDYAARNPHAQFFLGMDCARKIDLCVIDVGEKIGDVVYDRLRIEMLNQPYHEMEEKLYQLLDLPQLQRACFDANGCGSHLAERAEQRHPWKVRNFMFTPAEKQTLAYGLHEDFKDGHLRIPHDDKLRADLRGIKKEVNSSGRISFSGEAEDSHCDRFWAKALRQEATRHQNDIGAEVG
ncbi:MAG TPA: terminase family protein, partial [Candidatus Dormibacteraeota bacterium]|nr:terminase family protein [Candidatus Dormibacteraeota bacterium]